MFVFLPQYLDIQIFVYSLQWINFALRESKGLWKSVFIASNYGLKTLNTCTSLLLCTAFVVKWDWNEPKFPRFSLHRQRVV